ncbi:ribonuclease III [Novosphingopyxis sp.]|uniref:ribonuclease III n=1 Tax=Novosphingopyxis sp. TaxID=2709690 RepID=UPI003B5C0265
MSDLSAWLAATGIEKVGDLPLYERAMTHGSTGRPDYQRLEFLGDRVLGLAVAEMLYDQFPDEPEGKLSHRLNALVSGTTCAEVARSLDAGPLIILGKQARSDGAAESDNVLGDVMESIIGALFLDQGIDPARRFVESLWRDRIIAAATAPRHPKSLLQEWAASSARRPPVYEIVARTGPAHSRLFKVSVSVKGLDPITATAPSKREAETRAAKAFLEKYR